MRYLDSDWPLVAIPMAAGLTLAWFAKRGVGTLLAAIVLASLMFAVTNTSDRSDYLVFQIVTNVALVAVGVALTWRGMDRGDGVLFCWHRGGLVDRVPALRRSHRRLHWRVGVVHRHGAGVTGCRAEHLKQESGMSNHPWLVTGIAAAILARPFLGGMVARAAYQSGPDKKCA